jgi:aryl-alcohol dehydrogenase-like predicted oxidoreductase
MMKCLNRLGVGCIPWSPLGGGMLTRPYNTAKEELTTRGEFFSSISTSVDRKVRGEAGHLVDQAG